MSSFVYSMSLALSLASIVYLLIACCGVAAFGIRRGKLPQHSPPVTILKPVCGTEPSLYENLRSFCAQDYPEFQIIFGVRDAHDPAIGVIRQVIKDFPEHDLSIVIDSRIIGANLKVSNLANTFRKARHEFIVIADSDMRVGRDYLSAVIAPFADADTGAVTCLYTGSSVGGLASRLSAMFINDWFLPSVLVARVLQPPRYCFGATMVVRRDVLEAIGGFEALATYLADDYMLGRRVSELGLKVCLSSYVVENVVWEASLKDAYLHLLRWARTVRSVQPLGFAFSFMTDALPLGVTFLCISHFSAAGGSVLIAALAMRILLQFLVRAATGATARVSLWLIPAQDCLRSLVWATSFFGSSVCWRKRKFAVSAAGRLAFKSTHET